MLQLKTNKESLNLLIAFRVMGVIFGAISLITFLTVLSLIFRHFFIHALMYIAFAGLNGMVAYGFWKMRKWLVSLLGGSTIIVGVLSLANVLSGIKDTGQALVGFIVVCTLFLFTYFFRNFLDDDYKNSKVLGLFLIFLIISQLVSFFLK